MRTLIIYGSAYGNTEKIAEVIGGSISGDVKVVRAGRVSPAELKAFDRVVIGSPTQGGKPTQSIQSFVDGISASIVEGTKFAVFDTRLSSKLVAIFGYAAYRIEKQLTEEGIDLIVPAEGFFVKGKEGPLKEGELERAARWAQEIASIHGGSMAA